MNKDQDCRQSPVERLPLELVQMILSAVPDVASLQTAVLSCPTFYYAFQKVQNTITAQVLRNRIDVSVLPEAIAAYESSWVPPLDDRYVPQCRKAIANFVTKNIRTRQIAPTSYPLRNALQLERFHFYVDAMAEKFIKAALTKEPLSRAGSIVTHQERCRIERALYRFEIFCNLFCEELLNDIQCGREDEFFFLNFSPWENEQLHCINDFLHRAVCPAWNDVAEHDKLYQITEAETYEERYQLLNDDGPSGTAYFLYSVNDLVNQKTRQHFLGALTPEEESMYIKQPFFADPDSGSEEAWRWAHKGESWKRWVYQPNRDVLRQWGYVMWDRSRLETTGIFEEPWEDTGIPENPHHEEEEQRQEDSGARRCQIYNSGGTGWWSWEDESKVKWRNGVGPDDQSSKGDGSSVGS
ncbi:hypothetical protein F5Y19DRAFT_489879 [Xylariaceae sp. FL1651]|nr:hypothetical protein F5Y19DRAFT_489879 [Xylariaceae sp. FL1651]